MDFATALDPITSSCVLQKMSMTLYPYYRSAFQQTAVGQETQEIIQYLCIQTARTHYPSVHSDIAHMQQKDPDIGIVNSWLENKEEPTKPQHRFKKPV